MLQETDVFEHRLNDQDGHTVLALEGELGNEATPVLDELFTSIAAEPKGDLAVDFAKVTYLNSMVIRLLMKANSRLKGAGFQLRLQGVTPDIYRTFKYSGLVNVFKIELAP